MSYAFRSMMKLLLIAFCFGVGTANAQVVYTTTMDVDSIEGRRMLLLPDGNFMVASNTGNGIHLSAWNTEGDTLWTTTHEGGWITAFRQLATGEILIGGHIESLLVDQLGVSPINVPIGGYDILEIGVDSILSYQHSSSTMRLTDRMGAVIWENPVILPQGFYPGSGQGVLACSDQGLLVYSSINDNEFPGIHKFFLGKYGVDGVFQDSLSLRHTAPINSFFEAIPTMDGGALTVALYGTASAYLVRTNAQGDTTWTRSISQYPTPGYPLYFTANGAAERSNGNFILSGHTFDDPMSLFFYLLELDPMGNTVCLEPLNEPLVAWAAHGSHVIVDQNDRIHAFVTGDLNDGEHFKMIGYEELCFSTAIEDVVESQLVWSVEQESDHLLIQVAGPIGSYDLFIHDLRGNLFDQRMATEGTERIPISQLSSSLYLVSIVDKNGRRDSKKVLKN